MASNPNTTLYDILRNKLAELKAIDADLLAQQARARNQGERFLNNAKLNLINTIKEYWNGFSRPLQKYGLTEAGLKRHNDVQKAEKTPLSEADIKTLSSFDFSKEGDLSKFLAAYEEIFNRITAGPVAKEAPKSATLQSASRAPAEPPKPLTVEQFFANVDSQGIIKKEDQNAILRYIKINIGKGTEIATLRKKLFQYGEVSADPTEIKNLFKFINEDKNKVYESFINEVLDRYNSPEMQKRIQELPKLGAAAAAPTPAKAAAVPAPAKAAEEPSVSAAPSEKPSLTEAGAELAIKSIAILEKEAKHSFLTANKTRVSIPRWLRWLPGLPKYTKEDILEKVSHPLPLSTILSAELSVKAQEAFKDLRRIYKDHPDFVNAMFDAPAKERRTKQTEFLPGIVAGSVKAADQAVAPPPQPPRPQPKQPSAPIASSPAVAAPPAAAPKRDAPAAPAPYEKVANLRAKEKPPTVQGTPPKYSELAAPAAAPAEVTRSVPVPVQPAKRTEDYPEINAIAPKLYLSKAFEAKKRGQKRLEAVYSDFRLEVVEGCRRLINDFMKSAENWDTDATLKYGDALLKKAHEVMGIADVLGQRFGAFKTDPNPAFDLNIRLEALEEASKSLEDKLIQSLRQKESADAKKRVAPVAPKKQEPAAPKRDAVAAPPKPAAPAPPQPVQPKPAATPPKMPPLSTIPKPAAAPPLPATPPPPLPKQPEAAAPQPKQPAAAATPTPTKPPAPTRAAPKRPDAPQSQFAAELEAAARRLRANAASATQKELPKGQGQTPGQTPPKPPAPVIPSGTQPGKGAQPGKREAPPMPKWPPPKQPASATDAHKQTETPKDPGRKGPQR